MAKAPIIKNIVRQHAEMAAHLWNIYDQHLLHPGDNPDMDEERLSRLVERLEAHLDGLRTAEDAGREIAQALYAEFPEAGELFVVRMLSSSQPLKIANLDLERVRAYLATTLPQHSS
ncbi:hypothetical protein NKH73_12180 [Mesorhizobium sp. M0938]|uniref:hypothetical protein n=1 Tax=unclassified Mesorhizobium TaxID=325217 RepID=UPI003335E767